jgi:hypothetical protein
MNGNYIVGVDAEMMTERDFYFGRKVKCVEIAD